MTTEQWKQVEALYDGARAQPDQARAVWLAQACPDADLRREVESLLDQNVDSFLESSPLSPAFTPGMRLGNFELVELIGRGGMGEVWRAHDPRLKRDVAVKILPAAFAGDRDRISRFEHEARAAGALNHPNIVAVYDVGREEAGKYWIVSELVDGESLRALIARGPLPPSQAAAIAEQIAAALTTAHAAGIVHRDLKPGNIMLHRDGRVKLVDFGLAKRARAADGTTLTNSGMVMGTAGYMAPEQVRGEQVDHRADIFSFGVVLYEMLSGKQAFRGGSSVELMHAILKEEPPALPAAVPRALNYVVRRCLEKDPARRFQTAADLVCTFAERAPAPRRAPKWLIAAALAVSAAGGMVYWLARPLATPRVMGMTQITHDGHLTENTICPLLSDGTRLYYWTTANGANQVSVNGGDSAPVTLQTQSWSWLMDLSRGRTEFLTCAEVSFQTCELWAEPMVGGSRRRLGNVIAWRYASWSPNGRMIVYPKHRELDLADGDGNEIRKLATLGGDVEIPRWSPDGTRIRISVRGVPGAATRIWEVRPDGSGLHQVLPGWNPSGPMWEGSWTADGRYFVFVSDGKIWLVRDRAGSEPVELNTGVLEAQYPLPSADGKRLFFEGSQARNQLLRFDLKTGHFSLDLEGVSGTSLEYSRDGKSIVYQSVPGETLFRAAADGTQRVQLTWPPLHASRPHWSPDGTQIAFTASLPNEPDRIYLISAEGGTPRRISNGEAGKLGDWDPTWSPDGSSLVFSGTNFDPPNEKAIHLVDLRSNAFSTVPGSQGLGASRWSPDGGYIAAQGETKTMLYDVETKSWSEILGRTGWPAWSRDGEYLFIESEFGWWRVRIRDRKVERINRPQNVQLADWGWYVSAPDGSLIAARSTGSGDIYALDWELP